MIYKKKREDKKEKEREWNGMGESEGEESEVKRIEGRVGAKEEGKRGREKGRAKEGKKKKLN